MEGGWTVAPVRFHGAADLMSMTQANSLMIVPEEVGVLDAGATVNVRLLDDSVLYP